MADLLELWRAEQPSVYGPATHKRCTRCRQWLEVESFRVLPAKSQREPWRRWKLSSWCRECLVDSSRKWREENDEAYNARRREEYAAEHASARRRTCSECGDVFAGRPEPGRLFAAVQGPAVPALASRGVRGEGAAEG